MNFVLPSKFLAILLLSEIQPSKTRFAQRVEEIEIKTLKCGFCFEMPR